MVLVVMAVTGVRFLGWTAGWALGLCQSPGWGWTAAFAVFPLLMITYATIIGNRRRALRVAH